jgi:hypothetical protein
MKSKDLRLGNLVNRKYWNPHPIDPSYCNDVVTVCRINESNVNVKLSDGSILKNMDVEAIPITEYWLLKFGFEKTDNGSYPVFHKDNFYFELVNHKKLGFIFPKYWSVKILYIHQIQNLYHSLTTQELTIGGTAE